MALTKVTKTGITDNAIDADKIEDGTVLSADIAPGTIENAKLANSSITVNGSSVSLGGSVTAKHIDWQSVITADGSTTTTAVAGQGYFIDTTSAAHTITLPASPSAGDTVAIKDYAGTFGTNNLTIGRNSENIQGVANDSLISTNRASVVLVYIDSTKGWLYTNESNVADLQEALYITATGGTETTSGDYKIHSFTGDGCFVVSQIGNCAGGGTEVSYLVVAGGGGGGTGSPAQTGAGGGAGGYREGRASNDCYSASPANAPAGLTVSATTYPVTVGSGGPGASPSGSAGNVGGDGSNSIFSTITSTGGGGGSNEPSSGNSGGSGGGGGRSGNNPGGSGNTPPVSPSQGNPGGAGSDVPGNITQGGGGGASSSGGTGPRPAGGGQGGNGHPTSITGSAVTRGGGGSANGKGGGPGGGGDSGRTPYHTGTPTSNGDSGDANTGGGGGGATTEAHPGTQYAGSGGKGIVVIRYKYQ